MSCFECKLNTALKVNTDEIFWKSYDDLSQDFHLHLLIFCVRLDIYLVGSHSMNCKRPTGTQEHLTSNGDREMDWNLDINKDKEREKQIANRI